MRKIYLRIEDQSVIDLFNDLKEEYNLSQNVKAFEALLIKVVEQKKRINLITHINKVNNMRLKRRNFRI